MKRAERERLSRTLAHALRHDPGAYGLELDPEGWARVDRLLAALSARLRWHGLGRADLKELIERSEVRRYELEGERIRALYGHSTPGLVRRDRASPPRHLYHGTSPEVLPRVEREGLRPMDRQYVHLSTTVEAAERVGRRRSEAPVILRVRAAMADRAGVHFYRGNEDVWLADRLPARYLERLRCRELSRFLPPS